MSSKENTTATTKPAPSPSPSPSPTLPPPSLKSPTPTSTNKSGAVTTATPAVDDEACDVIQGFAELMEDDLVPEKDVTTIETLTSIALESSKYADVISDLVITHLKNVLFFHFPCICFLSLLFFSVFRCH